jgi:hypothetical protein
MTPQGRSAKAQERNLWRVLQEVGSRPGCTALGCRCAACMHVLGSNLEMCCLQGRNTIIVAAHAACIALHEMVKRIRMAGSAAGCQHGRHYPAIQVLCQAVKSL